jgi:hypothetical protein
MLALDVRAPDLDRVIKDLAATEKQAQKALNSTLRKMATWLRTRELKGLSKELQLQQKILRRRLKSARLRVTGNGAQIGVWFGLNPVALIYLQPKKRAGGIGASGNRYVPGAFMAKAPAGASQVFKRRGTARLPIDKQEAEVQRDAEPHIERALDAEFENQFMKVFEHELQWATR